MQGSDAPQRLEVFSNREFDDEENDEMVFEKELAGLPSIARPSQLGNPAAAQQGRQEAVGWRAGRAFRPAAPAHDVLGACTGSRTRTSWNGSAPVATPAATKQLTPEANARKADHFSIDLGVTKAGDARPRPQDWSLQEPLPV